MKTPEEIRQKAKDGLRSSIAHGATMTPGEVECFMIRLAVHEVVESLFQEAYLCKTDMDEIRDHLKKSWY